MLTGAILVGGNNDIVDGTLRSFLTFNGQTIIDKQIEEMKKICSEIVIVTNQPRLFLPLVARDVRIITDYHKKKGPLGGIHAVMSLANNPYLWVVSCDMPLIKANVAQFMLNLCLDYKYQAVLPALVNNTSPKLFHSIYHKSILSEIEVALTANVINPSKLLNKINSINLDKKVFLTNGLNLDFLSDIKSLTGT
ncbi:molybdenum cofactor guanylyltransferase [Virgibacillus sp. DJP39]|uniref:molybdenum cofactor guanylyltransferase n=1 Tax=Virgibacillus sp. DJP39 TaxID=3409790 RepID=UPI003BB5D4E9